MEIKYKDIHDFNQQELQELFLSVEWSSGHFPEKLVVAMRNFETVYTAWDDNKLVGLVAPFLSLELSRRAQDHCPYQEP